MITTVRVGFDDFPWTLQQMASPPVQLYIRGDDTKRSLPAQLVTLMSRPRVAVVGTRRVSNPYGITITQQMAGNLAGQGVVIVSGLALGVDRLAHQAALDAGGTTVAVLPSSVEDVHPRSHQQLAQAIIESGGLLISEYPPSSHPQRQNFVARNRIVTALSNALLITEATSNSGTMHTVNFALEQGIDVFAVPGNITSPTSEGTNNLLKRGATAITKASDVAQALGLPVGSNKPARRVLGANKFEQTIIDLLGQGVNDGSELLRASQLEVQQFNHHLTMLEIHAKVRPLGANQWALSP